MNRSSVRTGSGMRNREWFTKPGLYKLYSLIWAATLISGPEVSEVRLIYIIIYI